MKFSYNWLQDFFDDKLPPADEVATKLGLHIFELEEVEETDGDHLIDWDVLPNRSSDCLCYAGIAAEISALFQLPLKENVIIDAHAGSGEFTNDSLLKLTVDDNNLVPRATKRIATGIKVGPSPEWLRSKMVSTGQNSINNIVDLTNYVMFMTGQPVHAFDYDKLADDNVKTIAIRHATEGEEVTDLTGLELTLTKDMMVVADSEKALDVAGVKGGINSGVDESTTRIVVSACNYQFENIRNTSSKLKLQTDASKRYENEVPLHKIDQAQALMSKHLIEMGAAVANDILDTNPTVSEQSTVSVNLEKINSVLGLELQVVDVTNIFELLGFTVNETDGQFDVTVPLERLDIHIAEDLIEEVGRVYGYANIADKALSEGFTAPVINPIRKSVRATVDMLLSLGFYEAQTRTLAKNGVVEMANPWNSEAGALRTNLLDSLSAKARANLAHSSTPMLFEIGKVFTGITDGAVDEHYSFAGVLGQRKIKDKQKKDLFYQTKGYLEKVFEVVGVKNVEWKEGGGETIAILEINGDILGSVGINWWELNFEELVAAVDDTVEYVKPSKYPKIERDAAVFVPLDAKVVDVQKIISDVQADKCTSIELFDVFEQEDKKSLGFRLTFQDWNETLSDEFANKQMDAVYKALEGQGFEIR